MEVERETAEFALPFAAGVLLASYSGFNPGIINMAGPQAGFIMASISLFFLIHPSRKRLSESALRILIMAAALSAGLICGYTSARTSICPDEGFLKPLAEGWGHRLKDAIGDIPFKDVTYNAIAKALITGDKAEIPAEVISVFRDSGASHILALSGLHLGVIYGIVRKITSIAGNSEKLRFTRSILTILTCGLYTLATGAGPSITRAFIFILLSEAGHLTQRHHSTGQVLLSSLIIQLTISPQSIKAVGFQLSYAAMAGIAFMLPYLKSFWPGDIHKDSPFTKGVRKIWNAAAMSISCQLTTAPIAYMYFGTLPRHFILTNLIALPLTSIIIPFILMTLISEKAGLFPGVSVQLTEILMEVLCRSLEIISSM